MRYNIGLMNEYFLGKQQERQKVKKIPGTVWWAQKLFIIPYFRIFNKKFIQRRAIHYFCASYFN